MNKGLGVGARAPYLTLNITMKVITATTRKNGVEKIKHPNSIGPIGLSSKLVLRLLRLLLLAISLLLISY
jgi:hypothetical protein